MKKTVCEENKCNGCFACEEVCTRKAIEVKDDIKFFNAIIDEKNV